MDSGGAGGGSGPSQGNGHSPQATFTVNLNNLPFQVGAGPAGETGAPAVASSNSSQGNLGRVMQDIWPQIEQRIAQQALAALRDRGGHSGTAPPGHTHSHAQMAQPPVIQPMVNTGDTLSQRNDSQHMVINIGGGGNNVLPDVNQNTDDHLGNQGPPSQPQAPTSGQQIPSVRSLLKSMEGSLPFVFLMLAKVLYNHRLGKNFKGTTYFRYSANLLSV